MSLFSVLIAFSHFSDIDTSLSFCYDMGSFLIIRMIERARQVTPKHDWNKKTNIFSSFWFINKINCLSCVLLSSIFPMEWAVTLNYNNNNNGSFVSFHYRGETFQFYSVTCVLQTSSSCALNQNYYEDVSVPAPLRFNCHFTLTGSILSVCFLLISFRSYIL